MSEITIVGGGLTGLVAAIAAAEKGASVRLLEAQRRLGGRARTTAPPYRANFGPHVIYGDGPLWRWLAERNLTPPHSGPALSGFRFIAGGVVRKMLPAAAVTTMTRLGRAEPPADVDLRTWLSAKTDERTAAMLCAAAGVVTFDHDPGRLSAAFAWTQLRRVAVSARHVKYVHGGWGSLIDVLARHATSIGVRIETGVRVDQVEPVSIVATRLHAACDLLRDETLRWESARCALLDVALESRRGDPFLVWNLDRPGWIERYTKPDPSLAPPGVSLLQAQAGLEPGIPLEDGIAHLEAMLDASFPGWRERAVWSRSHISDGKTGALDLPGTTWQDRPAIDRGGGIFVAGDQVAAPGLLSEVGFASAIEAARLACVAASAARAGGPR